MANFKSRFIKNFFEDVVKDYERSFIGSFSSALLDTLGQNSVFELLFTISKFEGNMGYSLTENPTEPRVSGHISNKNELKQSPKRNINSD